MIDKYKMESINPIIQSESRDEYDEWEVCPICYAKYIGKYCENCGARISDDGYDFPEIE